MRKVVAYEDKPMVDGTIFLPGALVPASGHEIFVWFTQYDQNPSGWARDFERNGGEISFEIEMNIFDDEKINLEKFGASVFCKPVRSVDNWMVVPRVIEYAEIQAITLVPGPDAWGMRY